MAIGGYLNAGSTSLAAGNWTGSNLGSANYEVAISSGGQDIVSDLSQGTTAGRAFVVAPPFVGRIGTDGSPLTLQLTDGSDAEKTSANTEAYFLYAAIAGECHLAANGTGGISNVFIDTGGVLSLVSGSVPYLHLARGGMRVLEAAQFDYLTQWGGNAEIPVLTSGNNPTQIDLFGGTLTLKRPASVGAGTINVYAGARLVLDTQTTTDTVRINLLGGELRHISGDITTLYHLSGLHDCSAINRLSTLGTVFRTPLSRFSGVRSGSLLAITTDTTIGFPNF